MEELVLKLIDFATLYACRREQLRDTLYILIRVRQTYLHVGLENASSHEW